MTRSLDPVFLAAVAGKSTPPPFDIMARRAQPAEVRVPVAQLPVAPWVGDTPAVLRGAPVPSFVGWPAPEGYLPPFAPIVDYASLNSTQELCSTVATSQCSSLSCINGLAFAMAPYVVDQTARLALDAGSPEFIKGFELYNSCTRAVMGGQTPMPNIYS